MIEHKYKKWETCYEKLNLNSKPVADCLSSGHGKKVSSSACVYRHNDSAMVLF